MAGVGKVGWVTEGQEEALRVTDLFVILTVVIASWRYTNVNIYPTAHFEYM